MTQLTSEEKTRTAIIQFRDGTKTRTYPTVEKMLSNVEIAKFLGAKVCMWFDCAGWIWS